MKKQSTSEFVAYIWDFYEKNLRDLPWRKTKNPYFILLSEVMLQQTQVSRVIEKYRLFTKQFPTVKDLASAPLSQVLIAWQGLGYNRRAKFLHTTAKIIHKKFAGIVPSDLEQLLSLPGIGKNTAGSLQAFCFQIPSVFIETNIRRVFIHHFFADATDVSDLQLLPLIAETVDKKNPREWYYALMDYGAYLGKTLPKNPNVKSKSYAKQSRFEGSKRQIRGGIIRELTRKKTCSLTQFKKNIKGDLSGLESIISRLVQEGMIIQNKNRFSLPS